ncbi:MAG: trehalose-phosphatase [Planctomycetota bacterium]
MKSLDDHLRHIARTPVLLVATDYDGTIAPIVQNPEDAKPDREALLALRRLADLAQTHVAVISGRSLEELARLSTLGEVVHLVGSHGSEFEPGFATSLPEPVLELRRRLESELEELTTLGPGLTIEVKPASVAFHYRNAEDEVGEKALQAVLSGPASWEGVEVRRGKMVIELSVVSTHKGDALRQLRHRVSATAVVFLGDDVTDEDAFQTLSGPDVGVKVGEGESLAVYRAEDTREVSRLLALLHDARVDWLEHAQATPIEKYSILSDQRTVALVSPRGEIDWMCLPRIDSSALFSALLGGPTAGHFTVRDPDPGAHPEVSYRDASLVLETRWPTFQVTDFLDCSGGRPAQRPGRSDLLRIIEGKGEVEIEFSPRLDFGRMPTRMEARPDGLVVQAPLEPIVLRAPGVPFEFIEEGGHHVARARVTLGEEPLVLELRYGLGTLRPSSVSSKARLDHSERYWSSWAQSLEVPERFESVVRQSALMLKALFHRPSGAFAAAGTTSLPEEIGGVRNWDYRFCWLRDSAMSASSLVRLGRNDEAIRLLDWILNVVHLSSSPERLQPLYTVAGEPSGLEGEIGELCGYRGSRPVRVGNGAAQQVQLDVFGSMAELLALLARHDAPLSAGHFHLMELLVDAVRRRWHEPDHGIWEIRGARRHHVHSKVMCWVTVDRALEVADRLLDRSHPEWVELRRAIAEDVLENGYKKTVRAFTAAYDGFDLDAAALLVGTMGLLDPSDERFLGTVEAIERQLRDGPTVYRYRHDDGLPGSEGGFHICASWLVEAYWLLGRKDEARELFEQIVALRGPTGLLSEQYDPAAGIALGNTPQAYSHIGVIDNALLMSE